MICTIIRAHVSSSACTTCTLQTVSFLPVLSLIVCLALINQSREWKFNQGGGGGEGGTPAHIACVLQLAVSFKGCDRCSSICNMFTAQPCVQKTWRGYWRFRRISADNLSKQSILRTLSGKVKPNFLGKSVYGGFLKKSSESPHRSRPQLKCPGADLTTMSCFQTLQIILRQNPTTKILRRNTSGRTFSGHRIPRLHPHLANSGSSNKLWSAYHKRNFNELPG